LQHLVALLLVAMVYYWRISLWIVAIAFTLLVVIGVGVRFLTFGGRAQSLALKGRYDEALAKMAEGADPHHLMQFLRNKVPFPEPRIRMDIAGAAKELLTLRSLASDTGYPRLPLVLRESLRDETNASLAALWQICQHMAVLKEQKLPREELEKRLAPIRDQIHRLVESTNAARAEIARLTLGKFDAEETDVAEPIERLKWQISELRKIESDWREADEKRDENKKLGGSSGTSDKDSA
jgi:hypothetical protein